MPRHGDTDRQAARGWCRAGRAAAFPLGMVVVFAGLTAARLNGSSMALLDPDSTAGPGLVAGTASGYRADEYMLSSPSQVGNVVKGFPSHAWLGLNDVDLHVTTLGVPVRDWTAVFSPQNWGWLAAGGGTPGIELGFAWHWWFLVISGVLGVYSLLMALRSRPLVASALAALIGLSPYVAWWSGTAAGAILGFTCGAAASLIMAWRTSSLPVAAAWTTCAVWLTVCAALQLYLPWLLSIGLVVGLVALGWAIDHRIALRRWMVVTTAWFLSTSLVVIMWVAQNREALETLSATYYPGGRRSTAGEGRWVDLLSAPTNVFLAFDPRALSPTLGAEGNPTNVSEASSVWFPLPVLLLLSALVATRALRHMQQRRSRTPRERAAAEDGRRAPGWELSALGAVAAGLILIAWAVLPLPDVMGAGVLEHVPGFRTYLALGLAAVVLIHVAAQRIPLDPPRFRMWGGVALVATAASGLTVTRLLTDPSTYVVLASIAIAALVAGLVLLLVFVPRGATVAASALLVVAVVSFAVVGPLNRGIAPMVSSPLASYLREVAASEGPSRWVTVDFRAQPALSASVHETLSGMTYYPDSEIWRRLAPTQRLVWNNYNEYYWVQDPTATPVTLVPSGRHGAATVRIDLCSPDVAFLKIRYVVSSTKFPADLPCYEPITTISDLGTVLTIWKLRRAAYSAAAS